MKCPNCKLINPPSALRCDCGYDFPSGTLKSSYLATQPTEPADTNPIRPNEQPIKVATEGYWKTTSLIFLHSVIASIALSVIASFNGLPPEQHGKLAMPGMALGIAIWFAKQNVWRWPDHWWPKEKTRHRES